MASAASSPSSPVVASLPSLDPPELSVPSPISPPLQTSNPGISYSSRGAVLPPLEHEAPVSTPRRTRAATKPAEPREGQSSREGRDDREGAEPTRSRGIPWLLGVIGVLVVLAVAAGALAIFTLGPLAPPDRSSPQATTNGYFAALAARDYNRAWAYLADSRNAPGTQTSDIASLKTDDDQYGQVHSARILSLQQGPVGSAQATVTVQRGGAPTTMNYALVLTLYDGQTWLISSVSSS